MLFKVLVPLGLTLSAVSASSCDIVRWAAGGDKGEWNINYPELSSGASTPKCTMALGAKGESVRSLQKSLNECYDQNVPVDDNFGPEDKTAVTNVQLIVGVLPNGIWDTAMALKMLWYATRYNADGTKTLGCVLKSL